MTTALAQIRVPYCIDPNWLPYEAIEDSQHIGLSADYISYLNETTPYQFELIETKNWQQSVEYLKQGRCSLLPMLNQTNERDAFLDFTQVYFSSPNFLVSDTEQPFMQSFESIGERTLGVTAGYRITEYIANNYPQINTVAYESELDGLMAVENGEVDLFVGSVHSVNNHIQTLGLTELKIAGWGGPDDDLRMGVAIGNQALLNSIDNALANMDRQQHFEIYNKWNNVKVIDSTNYKLMWQLGIGALVLFLLVLVRYFSIKRYNTVLTTKNHQLSDLQKQLLKSNANLQKISQKDGLTQLYNRHYFNQLISNDDFKDNNQSLCLIFLDLDWFKAINDAHGHVVGDEVLREFAQVLKLCCQNQEIVCRWGGEEFVIVKQPAKLKDAEKLCLRIQNHLKNHIFKHGKALTCSFGVAQLRTEETILSCLDRADQLLYQAKHEGRNRIAISA
ncbi:diguanylate cyclase [Marinicella sp. S1101]|uniref:diguanylate cyclase n=1 Tax=Marinicella marina TaxID=2996016 RepID=UPI002260AF03|nr:diguanylate cyclase [Marinicella marina]MCX7554019.1 diguanylate cyclase [Marinicella marina]MDJ1140511.1 diguanylate cyclase [Marinicella marina]